MFYYAYRARDGHTYCIGEEINASLMSGDYILFDSRQECIEYWKQRGVVIDRF